MSPDRGSPPKPRASSRSQPAVKVSPSKDDSYRIVYFRRHKDDDPGEATPGRDFLNSCPANVKAKLQNILIAVAAAPPLRYAGGGGWEAMHDEMTGYFEARTDGPKRRHYRLFCRLDTKAEGVGSLLTIVDGGSKAFRTEFSDSFYRSVRVLGDEYLKRNPRSIA